MVDDLLLACGNCEKGEPLVRLFQAAVGIRVVCGFPSAASVPTSSLSLSFFAACFSSLGTDSAFSSKNFASGGSRSHANACARPVAPRHFFRGQLFRYTLPSSCSFLGRPGQAGFQTGAI